ncbi:hypothetical protein H9P43_006927 [Blastocladiella emersonii ATCC 22665]|nr:hypothetical protein H9P43_006927 [Blastocladiella emersonii ATCC 22665]
MTSAATLGSTDKPAPEIPNGAPAHAADGAWKVWQQIAHEFPIVSGNPTAFTSREHESNWMSFTTTFTDNTTFFDLVEQFSGNEAGTAALITFKDSNWLMSIVLAYQPHFRNQPANMQVFWAYGLFSDRKGNYIQKTMRECTGREMLEELLFHLKGAFVEPANRDRILASASVVPAYMPFITSQFLTRTAEDRPQVVPRGSTNLAFVSQYVEMPDDVVFTVEYSVRAARLAVTTLMRLPAEKLPIPVYSAGKSPALIIKSLATFMS